MGRRTQECIAHRPPPCRTTRTGLTRACLVRHSAPPQLQKRRCTCPRPARITCHGCGRAGQASPSHNSPWERRPFRSACRALSSVARCTMPRETFSSSAPGGAGHNVLGLDTRAVCLHSFSLPCRLSSPEGSWARTDSSATFFLLCRNPLSPQGEGCSSSKPVASASMLLSPPL